MVSKVVALHGFTGCGNDFDSLSTSWVIPSLRTSFAENRDFLSTCTSGAYLVGYSMGGRVALDFAISHSTQLHGLILVSATPGIQDPQERQARIQDDQKLIHFIERHGVEAFLEYWKSKPIIQSQAPFLDNLRHQRLKNSKEYLVSLLKNLGTGSMPPLWQHLYKIKCPVLLVTGSDDQKFTKIAQSMLPLLNNAQHQQIKGVGHCPHLESPEKFLEILQKFIEITSKPASV